MRCDGSAPPNEPWECKTPPKVQSQVDVHPDGFAQNLAVGILRGSFRDSELHPAPLEPNRVYEVTIRVRVSDVRVEVPRPHLRIRVGAAKGAGRGPCPCGGTPGRWKM